MKELIINKLKKKRLTKIIYSINNKSQKVVLVYSFKKGKNSVSGHNIDNDVLINVPLDFVIDITPLYRDKREKGFREIIGENR